jgi:hypothetical protein
MIVFYNARWKADQRHSNEIAFVSHDHDQFIGACRQRIGRTANERNTVK